MAFFRYWWGPDEIEKMKTIGNKRARHLYGNFVPPGLTCHGDVNGWKSYLEDKYIHKKYAAPSETSAFEQTSSKAEVDLIQFVEEEEGKALPSTGGQNYPRVEQIQHSTSTSSPNDFFAEFGL